jgi:uncharacterized protein
MPAPLTISRKQLGAFCRRHGIRRLSLFGSALRADFRPESDVDVLVEFEPGAKRGMLRLAAMEVELGEILGRRADLNTPGFLSEDYRDRIMREAEVLYDAA